MRIRVTVFLLVFVARIVTQTGVNRILEPSLVGDLRITFEAI